jgi:hypothetical protein
MEYETFKQAYFADNAAAKAIGKQVETAFGAMVRQGLLKDYSSTWWAMCEAAYKAHVKEYYFG